MDPTNEMIATVVAHLAKKIKENKPIQDFFSDFTEATVNWLRPLFLKDENQHEKIIADLLKNPENPSETKLKLVETTIAGHLEDNPSDEKNLKAMYEQLQAKATTDNSIKIVNSKNIVTGIIRSKGNITIGDNNNLDPLK